MRPEWNIGEIAHLPVFAGCAERMMDLLRSDMIAYFQDREVMMHQGEPADGLFVLMHGSVRIETEGVFLTTRQPYAVIGEQAFIGRSSRTATVIAQGVVKALKIPGPVVEQLMSDAAFTRNLLRMVSEKLAESTRERMFRYRNEELLASEFRAHVAPEVLNSLLENGKAYGRPSFVDAIILLSDIRSFTRLSSAMSPLRLPFNSANISIPSLTLSTSTKALLTNL